MSAEIGFPSVLVPAVAAAAAAVDDVGFVADADDRPDTVADDVPELERSAVADAVYHSMLEAPYGRNEGYGTLQLTELRIYISGVLE